MLTPGEAKTRSIAGYVLTTAQLPVAVIWRAVDQLLDALSAVLSEPAPAGTRIPFLEDALKVRDNIARRQCDLLNDILDPAQFTTWISGVIPHSYSSIVCDGPESPRHPYAKYTTQSCVCRRGLRARCGCFVCD